MKIVLYQTSKPILKRGKIVGKDYTTEILDISENDDGIVVGSFKDHSLAVKVAIAMEWEYTEETF